MNRTNYTFYNTAGGDAKPRHRERRHTAIIVRPICHEDVLRGVIGTGLRIGHVDWKPLEF